MSGIQVVHFWKCCLTGTEVQGHVIFDYEFDCQGGFLHHGMGSGCSETWTGWFMAGFFEQGLLLNRHGVARCRENRALFPGGAMQAQNRGQKCGHGKQERGIVCY